MTKRRAGVILPLFSCPTSESWGIGELTDAAPMAEWLADAGFRAWQMLPINEMAPSQQSPYSAISAMAIDPVLIRLPGLIDFEALGGESAMSAADKAALAGARCSRIVDYATARRLKSVWLRASFDRFFEAEWRGDTDRARQLKEFVGAQAWWIEDYSLFRAIHAREGERAWTEWPESLQRREPLAIDRARRELSRDVLYYQYLQWIADGQWQAARRRAEGVAILGDLPFMVDKDSADVWARAYQFHMDVTIGAPPDAFSADGQDWGTPLYNWEVIEREDFRWLKERARRCADLFDGFRIDHLVGFYRTYARPKDGRRPFFTPSDERDQIALGERILTTFREPGSEIIAEDLGTVPDFVRESLARLQVPGMKVLRWERHWHADGQPFRRPTDYPHVSVAVSGTHDTEPMMLWWHHASDDEKRKMSTALELDLVGASSDDVRDALLRALFTSGADLVLFPVQDVFGWRDRINDPSFAGGSNWTYKLPWPADRLDAVDEARERKEFVRRLAAESGR